MKQLGATHTREISHPMNGCLLLVVQTLAGLAGLGFGREQVIVAAGALVVVLSVPDHRGVTFAHHGLRNIPSG